MASPPFCLAIAPTKPAIVIGPLTLAILPNPAMQTALGFHPFGPLLSCWGPSPDTQDFSRLGTSRKRPVGENPTFRDLTLGMIQYRFGANVGVEYGPKSTN
jgi:hypothetical protein